MDHHPTTVKSTLLCLITTATFLIAPTGLLAQTANVVAAGRVEGAGPTLSIGSAASGAVSEVLVHDGSRVRAGDILFKLDCKPIEAEVRSRQAQADAAQAAFDRARNGSRPDEIAVGEAVVGYSQARADEAAKTLGRTEAMREGVSVTLARVLEVERDARIATAQLAEAKARLSLLRAGSREEDVREAQAKHNVAAADLDATRARLDQCSIHAPVDGVVLDVRVNPGRFLSLAVPEPLLEMVQDDPLRVRAEVELRDLGRVCLAQKRYGLRGSVGQNNDPRSGRLDQPGGQQSRHRSGRCGCTRQGLRGRGVEFGARQPGPADRIAGHGPVRSMPQAVGSAAAAVFRLRPGQADLLHAKIARGDCSQARSTRSNPAARSRFSCVASPPVRSKRS